MKSGIQIERICFGNQDVVVAKDAVTLETLNEFHGAYDLDWVVKMEDGRETARFNVSHIETIIWKFPGSNSNNADDFPRADKFQPLEKDHAKTSNH